MLRQSAASATATAPARTPCTTHAIALVAPIVLMPIGALQLAPAFRSALLKRRLRCHRQALEEHGPGIGAESRPRQQRNKPKRQLPRWRANTIGNEGNGKQNPKMWLECEQCEQPGQAAGDQRPPRQKRERSAQQRRA
jgi:hypothetical protein